MVETIASQFAKVSQASTKAAFETRFNSIQRGILKRQDKEIEVAVEDGTGQRLAALQKERDKLADSVPEIRDYQFSLNSNANRFLEVAESAMAASGVDSDLNDVLSDEEVATLNAARDEIAENIRRLEQLYFPGVQDGNIVQRMRQDADRLDALTAVAGVVDPQGTTPATNENRELIDLMTEIQTRAVTFASSTNTLVETANEMIIDIQRNLFDQESRLAENTVLEIAKKTEAIDDIKARYGFLLKSISLSFEVQSGLADLLAAGTQPPPEKGSVLNLFT
jgi:hypothetical protein